MEERLYKEPTSYTPRIDFNPKKQKFEIAGISRPEDAYDFYDPILMWMEKYTERILKDLAENKLMNETFIMVFDFIYMNSSSSKYIFQIIAYLKKLYEKQLNLTIFWYYDDQDDQILEDGEDFSDIISVPFKFMTREQQN